MEFGACFFVERRILFRFFVEFHVNCNKIVNARIVKTFYRAEAAKRANDLTKLRAPVTEVVDANAGVTRKFVKLFERMADNRRTEVTDMERLCYVRRRIVKNTDLALAILVFAVICTLFKHFFHNFSIIFAADGEIKVTTGCYRFGNTRNRKALCKVFGDHHGRLAHCLGKLKARERQVTEICIRRIFERCYDVTSVNRTVSQFCNLFGNLFLEFCHMRNLFSKPCKITYTIIIAQIKSNFNTNFDIFAKIIFSPKGIEKNNALC